MTTDEKPRRGIYSQSEYAQLMHDSITKGRIETMRAEGVSEAMINEHKAIMDEYTRQSVEVWKEYETTEDDEMENTTNERKETE